MTDMDRANADEMTRIVAALCARNGYLETRCKDDRAKIIESAAIVTMPALILQGGKLDRAEVARNAVERAVVLADALDDYFLRETEAQKNGR